MRGNFEKGVIIVLFLIFFLFFIQTSYAGKGISPKPQTPTITSSGTAFSEKWDINAKSNNFDVKIDTKHKKDTRICIVHRAVSLSNSKPIYNRDGTKLRDAEKTSEDGKDAYCYEVSGEDYIRFGDDDAEIEYKKLEEVEYEFDWGNTTIQLLKEGEVNEDIFVFFDDGKWEFGGNDTSLDGLNNMTYVINSTDEFVLLEKEVYSNEEFNYSFPRIYNYYPNDWNEHRHIYSLEGACEHNYSNCNWELSDDKKTFTLNFVADDYFITKSITNVSECKTLSSSGTYEVNASLTATGDCITISADDVILDGKGFNMTGDGGTSDYGVQESGTRDNLTIKNFGDINNFTIGVALTYVDNSLVSNNSININLANGGNGIYLLSGDSNIFEDNTLSVNATDELRTSRGIYITVPDGDVSPNNAANHNVIRGNNIYASHQDRGNSYGIEASTDFFNNIENITIENNVIEVDGYTNHWQNGKGYGIYLYTLASDMLDSTLQHNVIDVNSSVAAGIYAYNDIGETMSNIVIYNHTIDVLSTYDNVSTNYVHGYGIWMLWVDNFNISNCVINTSADTYQASDIYWGEYEGEWEKGHSVYYDNILQGTNYSVYFEDSGGTNNTFVNTTFSGSEYVGTYSEFTRKWYFSPQVNYTHNGTAVNQANVTTWNVTGTEINTELTDSNGQFSTNWELTEYLNDGGSKTYYSNYTFNVTLSGWDTHSKSINFTTNYLNEQFNISDTTNPSLIIEHPKSQDYQTNESLALNYSVSDLGIGIDTCWYRIENSTSDIIIANTSIASCLNTTFDVPREDDYLLYFYVNDSLNQINSTSINFGVVLSKPTIVLDYPIGNPTWLNDNNVYFNFTPTYSEGIETCQLLGNWSGSFVSEYVWNEPTNATQNYTNLSIDDGYYKWNVWCQGKDLTENTALEDLDFGVDTIYPNVSIDYITTTAGSQTIKFNTTIQDANSYTCKYSIRDLDGNINGVHNNLTILCNSEITEIAVTGYDTYNLQVYAIDIAGNENSTIQNFTTTAATLTIVGGGGSSTTYNYLKVLAVIKNTNDTKLYTDLERARIYKLLHDYYGSPKEPKQIFLTNDELIELKKLFLDTELDLTLEQIEFWLFQFNNQYIDNVDVLKRDADRYDLIFAIIEVIEDKFQARHKTLDTFFIIFGDDSIFQFRETTNRELKSVELIEGELGLEVEMITNTTVMIKYTPIRPIDYTFKSVQGKINYISIEGESFFQDVNIRVINMKGRIFGLPMWVMGVVILFILLTLFNYRKEIRKKIDKTKKWKSST